MAFAAHVSENITVTIGDEPTLRDDMSPALKERELGKSHIADAFEALECKNMWAQDSQHHTKPPPKFFTLRLKRNSDRTMRRFKILLASGGSLQCCG